MNYNTNEWRKRRKKFIEDHTDSLKCSLCDKKAFGPRGSKKFRIHIHHVSYAYTPGEEPDEVLRILCPSCHELITILFKRRPDSETIKALQTIIIEKINTN